MYLPPKLFPNAKTVTLIALLLILNLVPSALSKLMIISVHACTASMAPKQPINAKY